MSGNVARFAMVLWAGVSTGCFTPPDLDLVDEVPIVPSGSCSPNRVEWVACAIDGDTFDIDACRSENAERVRLLGIDAPETAKPDAPAECWAVEAEAELRRLAENRDVLLTFDHDCLGIYGRTLAYVWIDDEPNQAGPSPDALLVNEWMLSKGFARIFDEDFGTPLRLKDRLEAAEAEARSRGLGLWSACEGVDR